MYRRSSEVRFIGSFTEDFPKDGRRHVVFVGRSNVGKSSLINMIAGKKIAYVSKEPGRTKTVNFFSWGRNVYLVDLPGYGYARVPGQEREKWKAMIERYFSEFKDRIALVFVLIDSKHGPTALDESMVEFLEKYTNATKVIVLTKWDKASQKERDSVIKRIRALTDAPLVPTSAREKKGKEELIEHILNVP